MTPKTVHIPGDCRGVHQVAGRGPSALTSDKLDLYRLIMAQSEEVRKICVDMLTDAVEMDKEGYSIDDIVIYLRRNYMKH